MMDAFGHGQVVQHVFVRNEQTESLLTACKAFKTNNLRWQDVQLIIMDKDFTELSVIEEVFPETPEKDMVILEVRRRPGRTAVATRSPPPSPPKSHKANDQSRCPGSSTHPRA
ncbi:TPA: hypothetical protein N0F65_012650 [Lagenidium giganteum]|uniref:ZSWIM1/3 RNaseH-like domain-containing protein n=1 Tax=Lagenidium giganteum TaxID=4803 RepID=A0AAV2YNN5_9STRA|nr:TPA: hypothetical protein N0F65_012650 [Lagenidium giganteum]